MTDAVATHFFINILKAAKLAGLQVMEGPFLELDNSEGLKKRCAWARQMGFDGKVAFHPKQLATINNCFSPDPQDISEARAIVQAYEEQNTAIISYQGRHILPPSIRWPRPTWRDMPTS